MNALIALLALASLIYLLATHRPLLRSVFAPDKKSLTETGWGIVIGFLPVLMAFGVLLAAGQVRVTAVEPRWGLLASAFAQLAGFALLEELLFRVGLLLALIQLTRRVEWAVGIQLALFGLAHASNNGANALTVVSNSIGGLMYALAFVRTGRFWMPWLLHTLWNFGQGLLGFNISGTGRYSTGLVHLTPTGPDYWSGGAYGLEGSLVGIAARFVVIGLTLYATRQWSGFRA